MKPKKMKFEKRAFSLIVMCLFLFGNYVLYANETETDIPSDTVVFEDEMNEIGILETEDPEAEIPETEDLEAEILETEAPETEIPETEGPETEILETEDPETEDPQTEVLEVDPVEIRVPESPIIKVGFPETLPFVLDPFQVNSNEQISSEEFMICNYSDVDVSVAIEKIFYELSYSGFFDTNEMEMVLRVNCVDPEDYTQTITTDMIITEYQQEDAAVFVLSASKYDENGCWESFNEGSCISFVITGSFNPMIVSDIDWSAFNLTVNSHFMTNVLE